MRIQQYTGLACPDDPLRTAPPGELPRERRRVRFSAIDYRDEYEYQAARAEVMTMAVLSGELESCDGVHDNKIGRVSSSDLTDIIGITDHPHLIAKWFAMAVKAGDKDAKGLLRDYIDKLAAKKSEVPA